jgi:hypothetical protein
MRRNGRQGVSGRPYLTQAVGHFPDGVEAVVQCITREGQDALDREAAPGLKVV